MEKYTLIKPDKTEIEADNLRHVRIMHKELGGQIKQVRTDKKGNEIVKFLKR